LVAAQVFKSFELEEIKNVNVLIIERDTDYIDILQALLKSSNFNLTAVVSAQEGLDKLEKNEYDLIFLSAALNQMSEKEKLIDNLREITVTPVIALTEQPDEENGITIVLDGADYDLQKPFTPRRLRAAITAVLRRSEVNGMRPPEPILPETLTSGDFTLSLGRLELTVNNKRVNLSAREFSLLQFLMANPNQAFTREELAAQAWGWAKGGELRAVDSAVKRLRQKIEPDKGRNPRYILTERNIGYKFNVNNE
jgi:DNA-binding response OmpR family regulator